MCGCSLIRFNWQLWKHKQRFFFIQVSKLWLVSGKYVISPLSLTHFKLVRNARTTTLKQKYFMWNNQTFWTLAENCGINVELNRPYMSWISSLRHTVWYKQRHHTSKKSIFFAAHEYGYLRHGFKLFLKNLLHFSPLWHPISWSFSLYNPPLPVFFTLCYPLSLAATLISCHPSCFSCLYFFLCHLLLFTLPVTSHVIIHYWHIHLLFSALKSR